MLIKNNLATILKEKGISFEQLAQKVNVPYEELRDTFLGNREFSPEILTSVARFLKVSEKQLLKNWKKALYEKIGVQLREVREEKNLTLIELGKMSGVSYTHISEIERGKTCASLKTLEKLARVLEIPTSLFFQLEESLTLGEKIRRLREKQNLTQIQLAEEIGVSLSLIGQIETGRVRPALDTLHNIANILGVGMYYFLVTEKEELEFKQKVFAPTINVADRVNKVMENLNSKDFNLIIDLVKILKEYNKIGIPEEKKDFETQEFIEIIQQLSKEDKTFVLENAKWLLKKAR